MLSLNILNIGLLRNSIFSIRMWLNHLLSSLKVSYKLLNFHNILYFLICLNIHNQSINHLNSLIILPLIRQFNTIFQGFCNFNSIIIFHNFPIFIHCAFAALNFFFFIIKSQFKLRIFLMCDLVNILRT